VGSVLCKREEEATVVVTKGDLVVDTAVEDATVDLEVNSGENEVDEETMSGIEELVAFVVDTVVEVGRAAEVDTVVELEESTGDDTVIDETVDDETLDNVPGDDDGLD